MDAEVKENAGLGDDASTGGKNVAFGVEAGGVGLGVVGEEDVGGGVCCMGATPLIVISPRSMHV